MTEDFPRIIDFDEMDLVEERAREIRSLEADLAAYLRKIGLPETWVTMADPSKDPLISVHGLLLTIDEASELARRLGPEWNGQSCERSWEMLNSKEFELPRPRPALRIRNAAVSSADGVQIVQRPLRRRMREIHKEKKKKK